MPLELYDPFHWDVDRHANGTRDMKKRIEMVFLEMLELTKSEEERRRTMNEVKKKILEKLLDHDPILLAMIKGQEGMITTRFYVIVMETVREECPDGSYTMEEVRELMNDEILRAVWGIPERKFA